jgi:hypothetical protein
MADGTTTPGTTVPRYTATPPPASVGGTNTELWPVGNAPPGYQPQLSGPGPTPRGIAPNTQLGTAPRTNPYLENDVWEQGKRFSTNDTDELQMRLVAAGLLKQGSFTPGIFDQGTASALGTVMANANVYGASWSDMLNSMQEARAKQNAQGTPVGLTNASDLATGYQNTAQNLTGGDLSPTSAMQYASYYQNTQRANAAARAAGQTYETPMSAEAYIQTHDKGATEAYNMLQRGIEFYRLLGVSV